ncbi:glycosyltransferase [Paenibacillus sp. N1-5-1-14]|uniref:glycosyltransferase family 2 protein n=1 Tax=Paenibacillus radicibacter TaxID=2972488 RepID=UPI0021590983|nr:glycosyltransferase family 2 protein [Paenibacillus radicibacter]MCR8644688.1 glycosyltransferase [Paenibacillus radicibacter]
MLIFLLQLPNRIANHVQTELLLYEWLPASTIIKLQSHYAEQMNAALHAYKQQYEGDFCLTLLDGEQITPHFANEIEKWIDEMAVDTAGVIIDGLSHSIIPRGPIVWRISALLHNHQSVGFTSIDWLPFEHYVLLDTAYRLDADWNWMRVQTDNWTADGSPIPKWCKSEEEWSYINTIIREPLQIYPPQEPPFVTIVLCTYNDAPTLVWAIRSVLIQSFTEWELLIIDDASTDDTAATLAPFLSHPRIQMIRSEINHGKASCLNQALTLVQGKWLLELDGDDWLAPHCLEELTIQAHLHPEAGIIHGNHIIWHERRNRQLLLKEIESEPPMTLHELLTSAMPRAPRLYQTLRLRELEGWFCADPFDGRLFEDIQMLARIAMNHPVLSLPKALYHRRLRATSTSQTHKDRYPKWLTWFIHHYTLSSDKYTNELNVRE